MLPERCRRESSPTWCIIFFIRFLFNYSEIPILAQERGDLNLLCLHFLIRVFSLWVFVRCACARECVCAHPYVHAKPPYTEATAQFQRQSFVPHPANLPRCTRESPRRGRMQRGFRRSYNNSRRWPGAGTDAQRDPLLCRRFGDARQLLSETSVVGKQRGMIDRRALWSKAPSSSLGDSAAGQTLPRSENRGHTSCSFNKRRCGVADPYTRGLSERQGCCTEKSTDFRERRPACTYTGHSPIVLVQ